MTEIMKLDYCQLITHDALYYLPNWFQEPDSVVPLIMDKNNNSPSQLEWYYSNCPIFGLVSEKTSAISHSLLLPSIIHILLHDASELCFKNLGSRIIHPYSSVFSQPSYYNLQLPIIILWDVIIQYPGRNTYWKWLIAQLFGSIQFLLALYLTFHGFEAGCWWSICDRLISTPG